MIFKILLALIIFVRLLVISLPSFKIDITAWQAWGSRLFEVGPLTFYSPDYFADYFPGYLYMLWFLSHIFHFIFPNISFFSDQYILFLKIFTNIFDIGTTLFIYFIVKKTNINFAKIGSLLYLANPALIFNSSVWGQVDGIMTFFIVASFYFLLYSKKTFLWSILFALAVLIKPQSLIVLPVTLIRLWHISSKTLLINSFLFAAVLMILSLPFFPSSPILGLGELLLKSSQVYPYTSLYAFNFWALVGWWQNDLQTFIFLTYQQWGILIYLIAFSIILFPFLRFKSKDLKQIFFAAALLILIFFLFPTRVHERYLFPFFAFFAITLSFYKSYFYLAIYTILSIIHLLNLLYVYNYYMYLFDNPESPKIIIYSLIDNIYILLSIISLTLFIILVVKYLRIKKIND